MGRVTGHGSVGLSAGVRGVNLRFRDNTSTEGIAVRIELQIAFGDLGDANNNSELLRRRLPGSKMHSGHAGLSDWKGPDSTR
jgi:hypothetical protein